MLNMVVSQLAQPNPSIYYPICPRLTLKYWVMTNLIQIHGLDKQEFISILEEVVQSKLSEVRENDKPDVYSVQEVSKLLSVSELTVYNYIKRGIIPSTKISRKHLIKRTDLEEAIKDVKSLKYRRDQ